MAIDFPNSPTVNQTFTANGRSWTWSGTTWDSNTQVSQGPTGPTGPLGPTGPRGNYYESDTAPVLPSQGDAWFNTADATLYMYYGTAWVETTSNLSAVGIQGPTGPTGAASTVTGPTGPTGASVTGPTGPAGALYGNFDGGNATSNYGGLTAISGGNASGN